MRIPENIGLGVKGSKRADVEDRNPWYGIKIDVQLRVWRVFALGMEHMEMCQWLRDT